MDINTLLSVSKERRRKLNQKDTVEDSQIAMEITTNVLIIEKLMANDKHKTPAGREAYMTAKLRLIEIIETTQL